MNASTILMVIEIIKLVQAIQASQNPDIPDVAKEVALDKIVEGTTEEKAAISKGLAEIDILGFVTGLLK